LLPPNHINDGWVSAKKIIMNYKTHEELFKKIRIETMDTAYIPLEIRRKYRIIKDRKNGIIIILPKNN